MRHVRRDYSDKRNRLHRRGLGQPLHHTHATLRDSHGRLWVEDIHKEYERLKKLGVAFTQEPTKTDYGTQAVFDDTCGNLISIYQMNAD